MFIAGNGDLCVWQWTATRYTLKTDFGRAYTCDVPGSMYQIDGSVCGAIGRYSRTCIRSGAPITNEKTGKAYTSEKRKLKFSEAAKAHETVTSNELTLLNYYLMCLAHSGDDAHTHTRGTAYVHSE